MKRQTMTPKADKAVFETTANRIHKKNLINKFSKGGIRF